MAATIVPNVYLEWDILYDGIKTKKQRDKIVKDLMIGIKSTVKPGAESVPLGYDVFKSETNKLLYILRVFKKEVKAPVATQTAASKSRSIAVNTDQEDALSLSGPIRPSGPPVPPPPHVASITER